MKAYIEQRVINVANYIANTHATLRQVEAELHVPKSVAHEDMRIRLPKINPQLAQKVSDIIECNKVERSIRGGIVTKRKFERVKMSCN